MTVFEYSAATSGAIEIGVFSVTGARMRTLASGEHAAGRDRVTWDGRDERGQIAPAGVYIVRLEAAGSRLQQRLIKLP